MSAWVRTFERRAGMRFSVLYRRGGRGAPVRSAGTYRSLAQAEAALDVVRHQLAACYVVRAPEPKRVGVRPLLVYIADFEGLYKIGVSRDPERRCRHLNARLLHTESGGRQRERELHERFAEFRVSGEFFKRTRGEITRYIASERRRAGGRS